MTSTRKLAAIVFTDIVGYTALSARDEEAAMQLLHTQREVLKPIVNEFGGSWLKEIGDGLLLTFPTASSAVRCAISMQQAAKEIKNYSIRIGIHEGEITEEGGDVFGDDVNVASRIEPFAAPGGVAISHKIEQDISSLPEFASKYIGEPKLQGVRQAVKVYCITSHGLPETQLSEVAAKLEAPEKPGSFFLHVRSQLNPVNFAAGFFITFLLAASINGLSGHGGWAGVLGFRRITGPLIKRIAILKFEALSPDIDAIIPHAVRSELYRSLQKYRSLILIGDHEIERIDVKSLDRSDISRALDAEYLVSGGFRLADQKYLVDSELYQKTDDYIFSRFTAYFPPGPLQETAIIIADSLSRSITHALGISPYAVPVQSMPAEYDNRFVAYIAGLFAIEKPVPRQEIPVQDDIYSLLVIGEQLMNQENLAANLEAVVLYESYLLTDSANADIRIALGAAYHQRAELSGSTGGLVSKAEALCSAGLESPEVSSRGRAEAYLVLSKIQLDRGELMAAKSSIRESMRLDRSHPRIKKQFKRVTKQLLERMASS
ncbi:MAG: adenylate/guanylate cyclase domain-containing protein [Candidatus Marinimicrobia bacterium]|nr:adenylate/guanylate cyclase domain-containing protein [Candidatus Neomarinimicrobiota bacterium]